MSVVYLDMCREETLNCNALPRMLKFLRENGFDVAIKQAENKFPQRRVAGAPWNPPTPSAPQACPA
jgi:hypothetical protein